VIGLREKFWQAGRHFEIAIVNGETAICLVDSERLVATMSIATDGHHIRAVYAVLNPDKLR
jgi:hypothetical protein